MVDADIYDLPGANDDVQLAWKDLSKGFDIVWTPRNGGHWIAASARVVERLFRETDRFSNRELAVPAGMMSLPQLPITADGSAHKAYRAIIEPAFKPARLEAYRKQTQSLTIELIENFYPNGKCEFISEYALVLPLVIFLLMINLPPEDREYLHANVRVTTHEPDIGKRQIAIKNILDYIGQKIVERKRRLGDDLLSEVI